MEQNETALLEKREVREQYMDRLDVLDKVKQLFLIPDLEMLTTRQVAEWFEVEPRTIQQCYIKNKVEIDPDGVRTMTSSEFLRETNFRSRNLNGRKEVEAGNLRFFLPNSGRNFFFSKRAILRIAMLLRDCDVSKEIRTQLINIAMEAAPEQRTKTISEEETLCLAIGRAYIDGTKQDVMEADRAYFAFINRHVAKLEARNQTLEEVNRALIAENLTWNDRAKINRAVRFIGGRCGKWTGVIWNELYSELLYKHSISLRKRGSAPYIQYVRETEWPMVQQSLLAVCGIHGIDIEKVLEAARIA